MADQDRKELEAALKKLERGRFKSPEEAQVALAAATLALNATLETAYEVPEVDLLEVRPFVTGDPDPADIKSFMGIRRPDWFRTPKLPSLSPIERELERYLAAARKVSDQLKADEYMVTIGLPPSVSVSLTWRKPASP